MRDLRVFVPGQIYGVTQRGNNGQRVLAPVSFASVQTAREVVILSFAPSPGIVFLCTLIGPLSYAVPGTIISGGEVRSRSGSASAAIWSSRRSGRPGEAFASYLRRTSTRRGTVQFGDQGVGQSHAV